jgi:hypothetical protein
MNRTFYKGVVMEKRLFLLTVVPVVVFSGSAVFALDFMGPPTAGLQKGQFGAGLEYSFADMDLSWNHGKKYYTTGGSEHISSVKFKTDWEMRKLSANLGYGIMDNWEAFLRLGCVVVDGKADFPWGSEGDLNGHHGDAIGFGTKVTFWEQSPKIHWGGLFQVNWNNNLEGKLKTRMNGQASMPFEYDFTEYQFAFGPVYEMQERLYIYSGLFFHFLSGNVKSKGSYERGTVSKYCWDIDERSTFGGYIGTQVNVMENVPFYIEYQHTADADALGMYMALKFGP